MSSEKKVLIIIRIIAILLFLGGLSHWLVIFGVFKEEAPKIITMYFHSLAILNPLASFGLWQLKNWGRRLAIFTCLLQFPSHGWMIAQQLLRGNALENWRFLDIVVISIFLIFFNLPKTKEVFHG